MSAELWPPLPYEEWKDTYATLHMWTQIVGKVALAGSPPINHAWGIAFDVTPRGLSTRTLSHEGRAFRIEFDFIDHRLRIMTSDGDARTLPLAPRSVAEFYRAVIAMLRDMSLPSKIWPMPVEVTSPIRFDQDVQHHTYDREQANRFWRILVQVDRVLTSARAKFLGKASPTHFFWGGFDLAVTRFSGRPAPPRDGPAFVREAYSHEVISHGFWPGSGPVLEAAFYAYAAPEPAGFRETRVHPEDASYDPELGEFILPYEAVRAALSPDHEIREFIETTYESAATLARWDRNALERQFGLIAE